MDLCADQLLSHLPTDVRGIDVAPRFSQLFSSIRGLGRIGFNADRFLNRHLLLPHHVRTLASRADFFHIADHSYAHLALSLPATRVGVYCHDLDAFRCLLEPLKEPRPRWFRVLAKRTLAGLQRAAVVFHSTPQVGREIRHFGLVSPERLFQAPYGTASEFTRESAGGGSQPVIVREPYLLHVGGDMPRKRLDVLLDIFSEVNRIMPEVSLVQVGPPWSTERLAQLERLSLKRNEVIKVTGIPRDGLASLYRRAVAVLMTSESEGFGLPVIEAMACGALVIASDIPVLREVGGPAALYRPVAEVRTWANTLLGVLSGNEPVPSVAVRLSRAREYSWTRHAEIIVNTYNSLQRGR